MAGLPRLLCPGRPRHRQVGRPPDAPMGLRLWGGNPAVRHALRPTGARPAPGAVPLQALPHEGPQLGGRHLPRGHRAGNRVPPAGPGRLPKPAGLHHRAGAKAHQRRGGLRRYAPVRPGEALPQHRGGSAGENLPDARALPVPGGHLRREVPEFLPPGQIHGGLRGRPPLERRLHPLLPHLPRLKRPAAAGLFYLAGPGP